MQKVYELQKPIRVGGSDYSFIGVAPYINNGNFSLTLLGDSAVDNSVVSINIDPLPEFEFYLNSNSTQALEAGKWLMSAGVIDEIPGAAASGFCIYTKYRFNPDAAAITLQ